MGQINVAHALFQELFDSNFRLPNPGSGRVLVGREKKGGKLQLISVPRTGAVLRSRRVRGRARRTLALHRRGGR